MQKRRILWGATLLLALCCALPAAAAEKVYTLRFASLYPERHPTAQDIIYPWIEELKAKTNGRLVVRYYSPNTITPEAEAYNSVVNGLVDIGGLNLGRVAGKFPLHNVGELPLLVSNAESASKMIWDLREQFPAFKDELKDVKLLAIWGSPTYEVHSTKTPVLKLEEVKNIKALIWTGSGAKSVKALGGNPIQISSSDTYMSLSRGMADGVVCPTAFLRSQKLEEPLKHTTLVGLYPAVLGIVMNQKAFDRLPEDLKAIFDESVKDMALRCAKSLDATTKSDQTWLTENGHQFHNLDDAELARWKTAVQPVRTAWVEEMKAAGVPDAQQILDAAVSLGSKYTQETASNNK